MKMKVEIIDNYDNDVLEQLIRIDREAFGEGSINIWTLVPFIRYCRVIALYDEEKIIGGAQFIRDWKNSKRAYIFGIAIDAKKRGQGLGTYFLKECLTILYNEGIKKVELTVSSDNKGALRVYKDKLGFKITGERKNEYGPGQDRVIMECELPVP